MNNERQINYVNNLQNRAQNLYYIDDADELNNIDLKENDKIYAINDNKLFQMEIADREEELSGSIVSFNGRNNTKIKSLVVNIEPQQDLHGYDHPWPGGGGVNLIDPDKCTLGVRLTNTGTTTPATNWAVTDWIPVTAETDYIIRNSIPAANGYAVCYYDANKDFISYDVLSGSTDGIRKTAENSAYARLTVAKASVEKSYYAPGSVWVPFTPYENICPITGWTGANVARTGKNLFDKTKYEYARYLNQSSGTTSVSSGTPRWDTSDYIRVKGDTVYISSPWNVSTRSEWCFYDSNKQFISGVSSASRKQRTPPDAAYLRVDFPHPSLDSFQLEEGSSATSTQAYEGEVVDIDWADVAGTVYGCTLDVTNGRLTVDRWYLTKANASRIKYYFTATPPRVEMLFESGKLANANTQGNAFSSMYQSTTGVQNKRMKLYGTEIDIYDTDFTDQAATDAILADFIAVYKLLTPVTIDLDPVTISTISGQTNNIWSSTGNITVKIAEKGITAFELEPHT